MSAGEQRGWLNERERTCCCLLRLCVYLNLRTRVCVCVCACLSVHVRALWPIATVCYKTGSRAVYVYFMYCRARTLAPIANVDVATSTTKTTTVRPVKCRYICFSVRAAKATLRRESPSLCNSSRSQRQCLVLLRERGRVWEFKRALLLLKT